MVAGKDDDTRAGTAPPRLPKIPPDPRAKAPPEEEESDQTRIASAPPPPAVKLRPPVETPPAAAAPPAAEQTRVRAAPPPPPHAPAPAAVAPPNSPAKYAQDDEDDETVILVQRPQTNVRLQRLQPPGRSEIILLDRTTYLLGRSHTCDIELFSSTASRAHARLTNRDGKWYVAPVESRSVRVNGVAVNGEVPLTHKGRVQLGGDELLFLDESSAPTKIAAPPTPAPRRWLSVLFVVAIVVVVATAIWWLLRS